MPDPNPGLMTIFGEALERADPAERAAYLDRACSALRRSRCASGGVARGSRGGRAVPRTRSGRSSPRDTGRGAGDGKEATLDYGPDGATGTFTGPAFGQR